MIEKLSDREIREDELSRPDVDEPFYPPEFAKSSHRSLWSWRGLWLDDVLSGEDIVSLMESTGSMVKVVAAEGKVYIGSDNAPSIEDVKSKLEVIVKHKVSKYMQPFSGSIFR